MIAQFAGQDQRNWDEKWPEIILAVNTSTSESTGHTPAFLTQGREPRLPSSLYDKETLGTGRATETPEENANKLREVFEIIRRNIEKASQDQARHCNLKKRQWSLAVGDIVWAKEHHLSKAAEGFAAKLAGSVSVGRKRPATRNRELGKGKLSQTQRTLPDSTWREGRAVYQEALSWRALRLPAKSPNINCPKTPSARNAKLPVRKGERSTS